MMTERTRASFDPVDALGLSMSLHPRSGAALERNFVSRVEQGEQAETRTMACAKPPAALGRGGCQ